MASNTNFSERHPKLNLFFGFIILIFLIIAGVFAAQWLLDQFVNIIEAVSKMDAVVITALITGDVSIVSVIISSIVGKIIEFRKSRQEYLAKKREKPYGEFTEMIYKLMEHSKDGKYSQKQMSKDLTSFSREITLWGSKEVVGKWVQFRKNAADPQGAMKNLLLVDDIMNEMRKDLGMKKVGQKELLSFFINDTENIKNGGKNGQQ